MRVYFVILMVSPLFWSGCAILSRASEENARKVRSGQTATVVSDLIGNPKRKIRNEKLGLEYWYYMVHESGGARSHPYRATFSKGLLQSWDFDTDGARADAELNEARSRALSEPTNLPFAAPNNAPPLK